MDVLVAIRRIVRAIDIHSRRLIQLHGITGPQALLLKNLLDGGEQSVGALARRVNLSQATVTDIVDRLERRGLVVRTRSVTDKRCVLVRATEAAEERIASAPPLLQEEFIARFRCLADWERSLLISSLQRVAAMMDVPDIDAAPVLSPGALAEPGAHEPVPASAQARAVRRSPVPRHTDSKRGDGRQPSRTTGCRSRKRPGEQ